MKKKLIITFNITYFKLILSLLVFHQIKASIHSQSENEEEFIFIEKSEAQITFSIQPPGSRLPIKFTLNACATIKEVLDEYIRKEKIDTASALRLKLCSYTIKSVQCGSSIKNNAILISHENNVKISSIKDLQKNGFILQAN